MYLSVGVVRRRCALVAWCVVASLLAVVGDCCLILLCVICCLVFVVCCLWFVVVCCRVSFVLACSSGLFLLLRLESLL